MEGSSSNFSKRDFNATGRDEDGSLWGDSDEELNNNSNKSDLDREWERRRDQFHNIGYRDGLSAGKEAIAQQGFNIGFKQSAPLGFNWGLVRGVTSAFASLPKELKERLIESQEKRDKFQAFSESVTKKVAEQSQYDMSALATTSLESQIADGSLGNYAAELRLLLLESPAIELHLSVT